YYDWAQWLMYQDSGTRVYLDGRWDTVYSREIIESYFKALIGRKEYLERYDTRWVLIPPEFYLNDRLRTDPNWELLVSTNRARLWKHRNVPLTRITDGSK
ncbi:MAG: hypothetical protein ABEJ65_01420, partial [bacterium]